MPNLNRRIRRALMASTFAGGSLLMAGCLPGGGNGGNPPLIDCESLSSQISNDQSAVDQTQAQINETTDPATLAFLTTQLAFQNTKLAADLQAFDLAGCSTATSG